MAGGGEASEASEDKLDKSQFSPFTHPCALCSSILMMSDTDVLL